MLGLLEFWAYFLARGIHVGLCEIFKLWDSCKTVLIKYMESYKCTPYHALRVPSNMKVSDSSTVCWTEYFSLLCVRCVTKQLHSTSAVYAVVKFGSWVEV